MLTAYLVSCHDSYTTASQDIPQPDCAITGPCGYVVTVGVELNTLEHIKNPSLQNSQTTTCLCDHWTLWVCHQCGSEQKLKLNHWNTSRVPHFKQSNNLLVYCVITGFCGLVINAEVNKSSTHQEHLISKQSNNLLVCITGLCGYVTTVIVSV